MKKLVSKSQNVLWLIIASAVCVALLVAATTLQKDPYFSNISEKSAPNALRTTEKSESVFDTIFEKNVGAVFHFNEKKQPSSAEAEKERINSEYIQTPIHFEPNQGQVDSSEVKFTAHGTGYSLFLSNKGATFVLRQLSRKSEKTGVDNQAPHQRLNTEKEAAFKMRLLEANEQINSEAAEELNAKSNYFIGNDPAKWRTDIPNYGRIRFKEVYEGIDLEYYGNQKEIEYDFIVSQRADPAKIKLHFDGVEKLTVNQQGELILKTATGEIRQKKPVIYQEENGARLPVEGGYQVKGQEVSFWLGDYDADKKLVIDPILYTASYMGGNDYDYPDSVSSLNESYTITNTFPNIRYDIKGYAITGVTASSNFPTTTGTIQTNYAGNSDIFIRTFSQKFREDISVTPRVLVESASYTTYLGGSGYDAGYGIDFDIDRNVWITGETTSTNFPTSTNGRQRTYGGGVGDAYITKINAQGNAILYSTFHGGSGYDFGFDLKAENKLGYPDGINTTGVWLTGGTASTNFPTISSTATQQTYGGGVHDAFVTDVDVSTSVLSFASTYLGGSGNDMGKAIFVEHYNNSNYAWVTGVTSSTNFPTTAGAYQRTYGGGTSDAFVSKIPLYGINLVRSSYLGGSGADSGNGIYWGNVIGSTSSTNFPTTTGAYQRTYGGGASDVFLTGMSTELQSPYASTFFGGSGEDIGNSITNIGNTTFITGSTSSTNFPVTSDAVQPVKSGGKDAFISKLYFGSLQSSTFYGGGNDDSGNSIAPGISDVTEDNVIVIGDTSSTNFPVTSGTGQTIYGGGSRDGFIITTTKQLVNIQVNVFPACSNSSCSFLVRPTRVYARRSSDSQEFTAAGSIITVPAGDSYFVTAEGGQLGDGRAVNWSSYQLNNVSTNQSLKFYVVTPTHSVSGRLVGLTSATDVTITVSGGNIDGNQTYHASLNSQNQVVYNIPALSCGYIYMIKPARNGLVFTSPTNGQTRYIEQDETMDFTATNCVYSLSPNSPQTFTAAAGSGSVAVSTASGCTWSATSNNLDWISITSTTAGAVNFSVAANPNISPRTGTMTIAGQPYTINQSGANPAPNITSFNRTSATVGESGFTLTINGSGFINSSEVKWGTAVLTNRTIVSQSRIDVPVSTTLLQTPGIFAVSVTNAAPIGGTAAANFTVNNPTPSITSLTPPNKLAGAASFDLIVNGSNFVNGSRIRWNGQEQNTTFISPAQIKAQISATDLQTAGSYPITVANPQPAAGSGVSNSLNFEVQNAIPTITSLNPPNRTAGSGAFELIINGTGFVNNSVVYWNNQSRQTTFVSPTQVKTQINADDVMAAGTVPVNVFNPLPGGGSSNSMSFTVSACNFDISPQETPQPIAAAGGNGSFELTTSESCPWSATSSYSWITITGGGSGPGGRTISFTVSANSGSARTGTITAGGKVYTVRQAGSTAPASKRFDFDGDGKADVSVFRPSDGFWYLLRSRDGLGGAHFGLSIDKITPADYDGDGKTDIAVFRNGVWFLLHSNGGFSGHQFGAAGDIPQPADFDGDGRAELAVYRPSEGMWYVLNLVNYQFSGMRFGTSGDKPVVGDYDGDRKADHAVFRPSDGVWYLLRSSQGFTGIQFGISTDKTVPADYDGDGKTDLAVYRGGIWYQLCSQQGFTGVQFGLDSDVPAPADFDGDGRADPAVFRNGVWFKLQSTAGFAATFFGLTGDVPTPSAFVY